MSIDVDLSGSGKRTTKIVEVETENGTVYDKSLVANELNDFFTKTLGQLRKDHYFSYSVFYDSKLKNLFHPGFAPLQVLSYLKLNLSRLLILLVRSRSTSQLSMMVLAPKVSDLSHHHLSTQSICGLLNLSIAIATNTFLDKWNIGQVTPVYKGVQQHERNNYCPIPVLPVLSKVLEKNVVISLLEHLQENDFLYELQSTLCSSLSTETALIRITDENVV